jgi:mannose-1-phosphate guanylyltransferase
VENNEMLLPVILSGGAGTRLWPVSREGYPKPFIRLNDGTSLLRRTYERAGALDGVSHILTVTNREYYFLARDEYAAAGLGHVSAYLLESCARNTAPAIAAAAFRALASHGSDTLLMVLPADHLIEDTKTFGEAVRVACRAAQEGRLVTFGISPSRPETGFGYIECGGQLGNNDWGRVVRFVEKPPLEQAKHFIESGRFLWNSGMFCFRADTFLDALQRCDIGLYQRMEAAWRATLPQSGDKIELDPERFAEVADVSVDYAVMEKYPEVAVVKAAFDWNDIGSWNALSALTAADQEGNRIQGETVLLDTRDCHIQSDSRVVAALGVEKLIVVDTPDALLIAHRNRAQDVKQVFQHLKLANHSAHLLHRTVHRPWGTYTVVEEGTGYKVKRIVVKPGASLSLQMHRHRSEHWVVLSGVASVTNDTREYAVGPNESTFIPAGHKHRIANDGSEDLVIIEVQAGHYVGEDDIVRFDDVYGRK